MYVYVWVLYGVGMCMCGFCNVILCVYLCFDMCVFYELALCSVGVCM